MAHYIPFKYYDMVEEYSLESAVPVTEEEFDPLAHYFQLLLTRLADNEEISEEMQKEMAKEAGINKKYIDDVAEFLNSWGND